MQRFCRKIEEKITSRGIIVLGLVIFLASSFLIFCNQTNLSPSTVTLTERGFVPAELVVREGDTVQFVTKNNEPFWPASNVHPTHTNFPDFDPRTPIDPSASWSFTFTKAGTYKYHDHINSCLLYTSPSPRDCS